MDFDQTEVQTLLNLCALQLLNFELRALRECTKPGPEAALVIRRVSTLEKRLKSVMVSMEGNLKR